MRTGAGRAGILTTVFLGLYLAASWIVFQAAPGAFQNAGLSGPADFLINPDFRKLLLSLPFIVALSGTALLSRLNSLTPEVKPAEKKMPFWACAAVILIFPVPMQILGTELEVISKTLIAPGELYREFIKIIQPTGSPWDFAGAVLTIGMTGPVCEELLFRGLILSGLRAFYPWREKTILGLQAALFGLAHIPNVWQMIYAAPMGYLLGYARLKSGSIWVPVAVHVLNNLGAVAVLYLYPDMPYLSPNVSTEHLPLFLLAPSAALMIIGIIILNRNRNQNPGAE